MKVYHILFLIWGIVFAFWLVKQFSDHNKRSRGQVARGKPARLRKVGRRRASWAVGGQVAPTCGGPFAG